MMACQNKFSDLMMDLAYNIDSTEYSIILLGVFTRKLISRRDMSQIDSVSNLLTHLYGKYYSEENLNLLIELFKNIHRTDLISKIEKYNVAKKTNEYVYQSNPDEYFEIDDDDIVNSQMSTSSMLSLSDEEKLHRTKSDFQ